MAALDLLTGASCLAPVFNPLELWGNNRMDACVVMNSIEMIYTAYTQRHTCIKDGYFISTQTPSSILLILYLVP